MWDELRFDLHDVRASGDYVVALSCSTKQPMLWNAECSSISSLRRIAAARVSRSSDDELEVARARRDMGSPAGVGSAVGRERHAPRAAVR
jgi:hypothetical protein